VFVKNKIDVTSERYQQYIDADIRNILGTKKANTERSNSSPNCSTSVKPPLSPLPQGDEMSQIGLTVNQVGSKDVTKYVFVVGGCDKVPDCETTYKTEEAIKGFIKRFWKSTPTS
jgi:hypothetical protein